MRLIRSSVCALLVVMTAATASAQVTIHAVGDLPGGPFASTIRDATKIGSNIIAVGGSASHPQCIGGPPPCNQPAFNADTPMLWFWNGSTGVMVALPDIVTNTTATNNVFANAITPDGAFIAGQSRSNAANGQFQAVRVTTGSLTNLSLAAAPFPVLAPNTSANAISGNGQILYGFRPVGGLNQSVRWDTGANSGTDLSVAGLPGGMIGSTPALRGTSADGSLMIGTASNVNPPTITTGNQAFRYLHGTGVLGIPFLPGGTWNKATAVTSDGNLALLAGNSTDYPNGEVYIKNFTTLANTTLGSPSTAWVPGGTGGMTSDGSVVAVTFVPTDGSTSRVPYIHNSHGWFQLASVLLSEGVDLPSQGWDGLQVSGMNANGTLLWGTGTHNGNQEGFVIEFAAGTLANYNPTPTPPANTSIVGAWRIGDPGESNEEIMVFLADGSYYQIQPPLDRLGEAAGFERGLYYWSALSNQTSGNLRFITKQDSNGDAGPSEGINGFGGLTLTITGDTAGIAFDGEEAESAVRINDFNAPIGGFLGGNAATDDSSAITVALGDGAYFFASDLPGTAFDGIEVGTYTLDPTTHVFTATPTVDTNGIAGLSHPNGTVHVTLDLDKIHLSHTDNNGTVVTTRVAGAAAIAALPPELVSVTPSSGSGPSQTFSYVFSDPNGAANIGASITIINTTTSLTNGCVVLQASTLVWLLDDAASTWLGPSTIGSGAALQNSQCLLNVAGASLSTLDTTATLNLPLFFMGTFAGAKVNIGLVVDNENHSGVGAGTFTVTNQAPTIAVTPSSGSGASQLFSYVVTDQNGFQDVSWMLFLINGSVALDNSCTVYLDAASNGIFLLNDAGNAFLGPIIAGGVGTVTNSQCTITAATSTVVKSGASFTFNAAVAFKPAFAGAQFNLSIATDRSAASSSWDVGTWNVP